MARIEESIEIRRPVEQVFSFTTDAKSWPKWQSIIMEAEQTSPGPVTVGTMFRGTSRMMGRTMPWTAKATEFEANRRYGKNIDSGPVTIEQHNAYQSVEGGTRFTILYDMKVGGFMKLMSPMITGSMRKELKKSLGNLKKVLEA
ncbi:MAG TPA: SRPBCC family protein [Methanomicrobiales archaeon]|nr:SRPBCC family protein [Methanomicrobiales archaeon]